MDSTYGIQIWYLGLPHYLTWMAFGHVIGVYSSSIIAGVAIHMITAISIGVAVGVFLYKTSPVPIPQLSLYVEYVTVWIVSS